jgi:serine-type D-Ala-D-Ala carboxypeptidase/endopeptidase (penicillin-binding protein 4)
MHGRFRWYQSFALAVALAGAMAAGLLASPARADLTADVERILRQPALAKAKAGVKIVRLGQQPQQDQTLVALRAEQVFIPASNLKIITTAMALDVLGPEFRFRTQLLINASGDLCLQGDGDPTLGDSSYLEKTGWKTTTVFEHWAEALKKAGVTQVRDVVVDDSIFEATMLQPNWPTNQLHRHYVPQVAGVNFNANCLDVYVTVNAGGATYRIDPATAYVKVENSVRVGEGHALDLSRVIGTNRVLLRGVVNGTNRVPFRVTVDDPALYAATVLGETLTRAGVRVSGQLKRDRTIRGQASVEGASWRAIAIHETPIAPVLAKTNKDSINLYAEALGKRAAAQATGEEGSWAGLGRVQAQFMQKLGAASDGLVFDDASGLSKVNAVSPDAFVAALRHVFHSDNRELYIKSMSIGGADGTLENRFKSNGLAGRVMAKSGSVSGVSTLGGYLQTQAGEWYAFSILMNEVQLRSAQAAQDEIVKAIDASAP